MLGNMLFNLRQPQRSLDREELLRCLAETEEALRSDLAALSAPTAAAGQAERSEDPTPGGRRG